MKSTTSIVNLTKHSVFCTCCKASSISSPVRPMGHLMTKLGTSRKSSNGNSHLSESTYRNPRRATQIGSRAILAQQAERSWTNSAPCLYSKVFEKGCVLVYWYTHLFALVLSMNVAFTFMFRRKSCTYHALNLLRFVVFSYS